jgi:hypothetical protein
VTKKPLADGSYKILMRASCASATCKPNEWDLMADFNKEIAAVTAEADSKP